MEFKFNFLGNQTTETKNVKCTVEDVIPAREIEILHQSISSEESEIIPELPGILKRSFPAIKANLSDFHTDGSSDVIPRVYEGGLKTWECSIDLSKFLLNNREKFDVSAVLELGCGSALPSIVLNPPELILQDYNAQVLESVSAPNLFLNNYSGKVRFFCGDWSGLPSLLPAHQQSLILTSETIYRPESYHLLLSIFDHTLRKNSSSSVLVAAKDYYFGLGGSVEEFAQVARSQGWQVSRVWNHSDGVPRSILQLQRKQ